MFTKQNNAYAHTIRASFISFIIQAILVNFAPLLFLTFQSSYGLSFAQITTLITANFVTQLVVDLISVKYAQRLGTRNCMLLAHATITAGFLGLALFPALSERLFSTAYVGLMFAVMLYAIGGGLIEVIGSPLVEACPSQHKAATMSLLHSFYCWGHVFVVVASTIFFAIFGLENWKILAVIWALVPLCNGIYFCFVPIPALEGAHTLSVKTLVKNKLFWVLLLLMVCAGAAEQAMSQWASTFAEEGLGVSKTIGDLAGPCLFAICMGVARVFYGKFGEKIDLSKFMIASGALCIFSYLVVAFSPLPIFAFVASAACGLAVGIMWPGTVSIGAEKIPAGGTAMFAFFALAGDVGCTVGPTTVGLVFGSSAQLQTGFTAALIFPAVLILGILFCRKYSGKA